MGNLKIFQKVDIPDADEVDVIVSLGSEEEGAELVCGEGEDDGFFQ